MAKHQYSPKIGDIWKGVEPLLSQDGPLEPHVKQALDLVISRLEERDAQLEASILGDLVVNNVSGSVGAVTPPLGRQIGWLVNFGFFSGTSGAPDVNGEVLMPVTYGEPFPIDTAVVMPQVLFPADPTQAVAVFLQPGTATASGFTVGAFAAAPITISLCYCAVGF